jgi:hypothetical protein
MRAAQGIGARHQCTSHPSAGWWATAPQRPHHACRRAAAAAAAACGRQAARRSGLRRRTTCGSIAQQQSEPATAQQQQQQQQPGGTPALPPLLGDVRVVLVAPKTPANVGAAARACANFEALDLVVVAPRCDPRDDDAHRVAVGRRVLDGLTVVDALADALADCTGSVGFTRRAGATRLTHVSVAAMLRDYPGAIPGMATRRPGDAAFSLDDVGGGGGDGGDGPDHGGQHEQRPDDVWTAIARQGGNHSRATRPDTLSAPWQPRSSPPRQRCEGQASAEHRGPGLMPARPAPAPAAHVQARRRSSLAGRRAASQRKSCGCAPTPARSPRGACSPGDERRDVLLPHPLAAPPLATGKGPGKRRASKSLPRATARVSATCLAAPPRGTPPPQHEPQPRRRRRAGGLVRAAAGGARPGGAARRPGPRG